MTRDIDRNELVAKLEAGPVRLLDAQGPGLYETGHIPGAIHGRMDDPDGAVAQLGDDLDAEVVVYCTDLACTGSALAAKLLEGRGYRNVLRYADGKADWTDAGLPIKTGAAHDRQP